jgi:Putative peptidoglycan binding domain/Common central domain of tyrosinase
MALGDGVRRNIASVSAMERQRLRDAFLALDMTHIYPDGVTVWDKQEEIHKSAHAGGQDVHDGPGFLPWHRELVNRLEAAIREVDSDLSLHYWDWTTDPTTFGGVNLFTSDFMGQANGDAGPPFQNFESTEGPGHPVIWRDVTGGAPGITPDQLVVTNGDNLPNEDQFIQMNTALQGAHNSAHGYIGGSIGFQHFSFHDPFVFLLHSNADRLLAMWQLAPGRAWRLDPDQVYGTAGNDAAIVGNLEPWAGGEGLRPWSPPDNQQEVKNCKDLSVVLPPLYDTNPREVITLSPWPIVKRGHTNHPVQTLQHLLRARRRLVTVDGIFGPRTEAAIRSFQQQRGLAVDGIVGPHTWTALIVTVKRGSQGEAVKGVQVEINFRNLSGNPALDLKVDGLFGPKTDNAVRDFQQALALEIPTVTVDGIVGPVTWQGLVSGMFSF